MKLFLSSFALVLAFAGLGLAQDLVTPNDTARYLAGLPVRDTPLEGLTRNAAWVDHATQFDRSWQEIDARQLSKIRDWSAHFLPEVSTEKGPVFYMFSGPDILYAQTFFPGASTYVLAGLEPVGPVPDIEHLPPGALSPSLANLRKSLNSVLSFSFFITKEMKVDLHQNQLSGTLPVLYVFLARAGCRIDSVERVSIDKSGTPSAGKGAAGVKIGFFGPSGAPQTLYYFETDLSNEGIKSQPGFLRFCQSLGEGRSLLKAASYLPHLPDFTTVRDFLLAHSGTIIEDDSGIPIKYFEPAKWTLRYFGNYSGPIDIFKQYFQPELAAIYSRSHPAPLSFGFGYSWHPIRSSLILATARSSGADNLPNSKTVNTPAP
jgi:hypothetical protein